MECLSEGESTHLVFVQPMTYTRLLSSYNRILLGALLMYLRMRTIAANGCHMTTLYELANCIYSKISWRVRVR